MANKKAVLVTGGAGFIGSHLAEKLLLSGRRVFVLDNLSTGRKSNIEHLLGDRNFSFTKGSVLNKVAVNKFISQVDEIYHLAAAVGVKNVMEKPLESLLVNIRGTEIVLDRAKERKIPTFIASSSEIYGKNTKVPFNEEEDRIYGSVYNYRWGYAFSKGIDEFMALAYLREKGVPVRIARFFNTVGPRQSGEYGMVLPRFVRQALRSEPLLVHGTGKQTRCFGDVDDVTDAVIKIMDHPKSIGKIYNLGSDYEISIESLAKRVINLTGSNSKIRRISYGEAYGEGFEDMRRRKPDLSGVRSLIGYRPKTTLNDTIKKVIEHEFDTKNSAKLASHTLKFVQDEKQ